MRCVLLGPQRFDITAGDVVHELGVQGPLAVITAGWQERELEMDEFNQVVGMQTQNLALYHRMANVFHDVPELREAHRSHQEHVKRLQELYRLRLNFAQGAVEALMDRRHFSDPHRLDAEIQDAIGAVRRLDDFHLDRIQQAVDGFLDYWKPEHHPRLQREYDELAEIMSRCSTLLIAGGHVAVLLNRMRVLRLDSLIRDKMIIAWSAGAMVLAQKVVLFHDAPPQGQGYAEVFERGLGLLEGMVVLPHATKRLRLHDHDRVRILAGRFPEDACLTLDDGSRIDLNGDHASSVGVRRLNAGGEVEEGWAR